MFREILRMLFSKITQYLGIKGADWRLFQEHYPSLAPIFKTAKQKPTEHKR